MLDLPFRCLKKSKAYDIIVKLYGIKRAATQKMKNLHLFHVLREFVAAT